MHAAGVNMSVRSGRKRQLAERGQKKQRKRYCAGQLGFCGRVCACLSHCRTHGVILITNYNLQRISWNI